VIETLVSEPRVGPAFGFASTLSRKIRAPQSPGRRDTSESWRIIDVLTGEVRA